MSAFNEFVESFKGGHLNAQMTAKMCELVDSVGKFQQKGKLTLDIELTPKADGEMLTKVKYTLKAPRRDTIESIMFTTPENSLVDSNPKQPELFEAPVRAPKDTHRVVKQLSA
jgi:hypothetical protein